MLIRALKRFAYAGNSVFYPGILNKTNPFCHIKSIHVISKRHASIHTRNILIQKFKLEHISNFGIFLLVRIQII